LTCTVENDQWSGKRKWLWAIAAPSSQHSMGHFSVVLVKTKIFYGPFNFCMGHLHRITKLCVSNGPWPLPFPITEWPLIELNDMWYTLHNMFLIPTFQKYLVGPLWSWLYDSWIYNYLCNQFLLHCTTNVVSLNWVVFSGYSDFLHQ